MMTPEATAQVSILLLAIVQKGDAGNLITELVEHGHRATRIDSWGGFLQEGNAIVLVGTEERHVDGIFDAIRRTCETRTVWAPMMPVGEPLSGIGMPVQVEVGGAVVFVVPVERCVRLTGRASTEQVTASTEARA